MSDSRKLTDVDIYLAGRLLKMREERGLLQKDVSEMIGVTCQQYQKYEAGKNRINAGRLWLIAKVFNVNVDSMFYGYRARRK